MLKGPRPETQPQIGGLQGESLWLNRKGPGVWAFASLALKTRDLGLLGFGIWGLRVR